MAMSKCLKVSTIPLAIIIALFYIIALVTHYWTTCDKWKYNNGLWKKCTEEDSCTSLYEAAVQYRYRDTRCNGKANSYYTDDARCVDYYRCMNGAYDAYKCNTGQFDKTTGACTSTLPAGCHDLRCDGKTNGQYYRSDGTVCKAWYKCDNGVYTSGTCAANQYFDTSSKTCVTTVPSTCQNPKCSGKSDGWHISDVPTCKNYFICTGGLLTDNLVCSGSTVANPTTKTCAGTAATGSGCKDPRCSGVPDGTDVTSNHCTTYRTCTSEMYTEASCPAQQYYDKISKACTATRPTSCVDYRCHAHGTTTYHSATDGVTCKAYMSCINGAYSSGTCGANEYYDSSTKNCTTTVPSNCAHPTCSGKAAGWYIKDMPTCKSYYTCSSQGLLTDNQTCSGNTVANPSTSSCSVIAPSGCKDPRCSGKANGTYTTDSWCKDYFECTNELYTAKTCGAGQYFGNGSCTSTRPSTCYDERCKSIGINSGWRTTDTTCKSYYRCLNGVYTSNTCSTSGEQFSVTSGTCVAPNPGSPGGCQDPRCNGKSDGKYISDGTTCRNYYQCTSGLYSAGSCSSGQVYHLTSQTCRTFTDPGSTDCKDPRCTASPNSVNWENKDPEFCRKYYVCANGFVTSGSTCPSLQYYNTGTKACTTTLPSTCRDQRCYGKSNGKFRVDRECNAWYECTNAVQTSSGTCSSGSKFDQASGTCVTKATPPIGCKVNGGYSTWTLWGACTATTGLGTKSRTRSCTNPSAMHGGTACAGPASEVSLCWTCPTETWMQGVRAMMAMATVGAFLALFWSILLNCDPRSRHPLCTGGALFLLAFCSGVAGLIIYHTNLPTVSNCELTSGWSMVLGWLGAILSGIAFIIAMVAMCQHSETRVSNSSDNMQMRAAKST